MRPLRLCALAAWAAVATTATAQTPAPPVRLELERLQLDPAARGSLVVGTGEVAPARSFRISAAIEREHRPFVLVGANDLLGRRSGQEIVGDRDTLRVTADYVLVPRVELYARASYIVHQTGSSSSSNGWGTPSFGARLGALQQSAGAPLSVAIAGEVHPTWGDSSLFANPADVSGLFRLEVGRVLGRIVLGAQGEYVILKKQTVGIRTMGDELRYGAVVAGNGVIRPELSYRGAFGVEGDRGPSSGELLAGVRGDVGPVEIFGLGGPGFFNRVGTPEWRALAGLALRLDAEQKAEEAPQPAPAAAAAAPAPAAPVDPCAPGMKHTPEQCPELDDDGDGIPNKDDACPLEPGIPELKGCPAKDTDGDGVPDYLDRCPTEPGPADNQGCPRAVIQQGAKKIELREKVQFDVGTAAIKPESGALLDDVASVLKQHPEIARVVIEGHTDSTGSAAVNRRLSQARADAVMKALVARGVEASRLSAKGFGSSRPIASNATPEGRDANRRVEISIAQTR